MATSSTCVVSIAALLGCPQAACMPADMQGTKQPRWPVCCATPKRTPSWCGIRQRYAYVGSRGMGSWPAYTAQQCCPHIPLSSAARIYRSAILPRCTTQRCWRSGKRIGMPRLGLGLGLGLCSVRVVQWARWGVGSICLELAL